MGLNAYMAQNMDTTITWKEVGKIFTSRHFPLNLEWLKSITKLPVLVKGILGSYDAEQAIQHGT